MLPPVKPESLLMGRQPAELSEIDICVMARNVDIGVMDYDVLPAPHIRAGANQIHRHRHQSVDPKVVRIRLMPAIMFNIETDRRH
jgi:hypothetical protein